MQMLEVLTFGPTKSFPDSQSFGLLGRVGTHPWMQIRSKQNRKQPKGSDVSIARNHPRGADKTANAATTSRFAIATPSSPPPVTGER
nr:hypothetical protein Iba_chr04aCG19490 [Ipomoea batatas]